VCLAVSTPSRAGLLDDIGYTQLAAELGAALPTGAGVGVAQIEAPSNGNYAPDISKTEFAGKSFRFRSGPSGISGHADRMARQIYGNTQSIAPGVTGIDLWDANDWLGSGFLHTGTSQPPDVETRQVENDSWIGHMATSAQSIDALQRLDYAIVRDGFTAVVGVSNGDSTTLPELLGQSYNTISVGRSDGKHGHGLTVLDGQGRIKPELVVPVGSTSSATARVSSAAALLIDQAQATAAAAPRATKALLLAGATKDEFTGTWENHPQQPLDAVFGAGELNIDRSSRILAAGQQPANRPAPVALSGWDAAQTTTAGQVYRFEVPAGRVLNEWSIVLDWNRDFTETAGFGFSLEPSLANLDLVLRAEDGPHAGEELNVSESQVDNVEHIYRNGAFGTGGGTLGPGHYALEVIADRPQIDYALAWFGSLELVTGDLDFDGDVDFDDIDDLVLGLSSAALYEGTFGVPPVEAGDTNGDGDFDFDDISGFVAILMAHGVAAEQAVPEPSGSALWCAALVLLATVSRPTCRLRTAPALPDHLAN